MSQIKSEIQKHSDGPLIKGYKLYRWITEFDFWAAVSHGSLVPYTQIGEKVDVERWEILWNSRINESEILLSRISASDLAKQHGVSKLNINSDNLDATLDMLDTPPASIKFLRRYNKKNFTLSVRNFSYKTNEVSAFLANHELQAQNTTGANMAAFEKSAPAKVNEIVFSYVSPTEVRMKCGSSRSAVYDQLSLGFKKDKNPKAWNAFLNVLKTGKPFFSFGRSRTKEYDNNRKLYEFINGKLIQFLNTEKNMRLPEDFKLYERDKSAGTGIYKINFKIGKYNANSIGVEELTNDKLMEEIEKCNDEKNRLNRRGDKDAESQLEEIQERFIPLLMEAHDRGLITGNKIQTYQNLPK